MVAAFSTITIEKQQREEQVDRQLHNDSRSYLSAVVKNDFKYESYCELI